jgi:hypothetical protein
MRTSAVVSVGAGSVMVLLTKGPTGMVTLVVLGVGTPVMMGTGAGVLTGGIGVETFKEVDGSVEVGVCVGWRLLGQVVEKNELYSV